MSMVEAMQARLRAATNSERIGLFYCTTEGTKGESGDAINERGELYSWWLYPDDRLEVSRYDADELVEFEICDPEYQRARAEVGLSSAAKNDHGNSV